MHRNNDKRHGPSIRQRRSGRHLRIAGLTATWLVICGCVSPSPSGSTAFFDDASSLDVDSGYVSDGALRQEGVETDAPKGEGICANTPGCDQHGLCTEQDGDCVAASDWDCLRSRKCFDLLYCFAREGACFRRESCL